MLFHIILQTSLTTARKPFIESNYQRCIFISICQSLIHLIFSTWRLWTRLSNYWVLHKSFWIVVSTQCRVTVAYAYISKLHTVRYLISDFACFCKNIPVVRGPPLLSFMGLTIEWRPYTITLTTMLLRHQLPQLSSGDPIIIPWKLLSSPVFAYH